MNRSRQKALFSFRTEYLGDLDYWCVQKHFIPSLQENRMCLKPLTTKGAREIIGINESILGKYSDNIIQGASELKTLGNDNQPCVYALILSVICQTLSETPEKERASLLNNLNYNQDNTIDDILLQFYKKKLKAVGLDYIKDEKIIAEIEDSLVDEKGKRSRRDTDEKSIQSLLKWIEPLSDKNNGLIKIIGKKEIDGAIVKTIEFPHDRLCKAIDSSRKERQRKIEWKFKRQTEWITFAIVSTIVGVIAFLWNTLLSVIKPIITFAGLEDRTDLKALFKLYHSIRQESRFDEGFSTVLFLVSIILVMPLLSVLVFRKDRLSTHLTSLLACISTICFGKLLLLNNRIEFTNNYVNIFTIVFFITSLLIFIHSIYLEYKIFVLREPAYISSKRKDMSLSLWPLWAGYFVFASYIFWECVFRTTFGSPEPSDSFWAISVLPLLSILTFWKFFCMKTNKNGFLYKLGLAAITLIVCLLSYISLIPAYSKQTYGMIFSLVLILVFILVLVWIIWNTISTTCYYVLNNTKRILSIVGISFVLILSFIINLGYNPIYISPSNVFKVVSWKTVLAKNIHKDSTNIEKMGVLYANNGEQILPYCIIIDSGVHKKLVKNDYYYSQVSIPRFNTKSPFSHDSIVVNSNESLSYDPRNHSITGRLRINPILESHLRKIKEYEGRKNMSHNDSIDLYATKVFLELRKIYIDYLLNGTTCNLKSIPSLYTLEGLQHDALKKELKISLLGFDKSIITGRETPAIRERIDILEDRHLVDFHRVLSRSLLLCILKDRIIHHDFPALFSLSDIYVFTFFPSVESLSFHVEGKISISLHTERDTIRLHNKWDIYSDDITNKKLFAWYMLFNSLCYQDIAFNQKKFTKLISNDGFSKDLNRALVNLTNELKKRVETAKLVYNNLKLSKLTVEEKISLTENYLNLFKKDAFVPLRNMIDSIKTTVTEIKPEQSFKQLLDELNSYLPRVLSQNDCNGIYNNDFENVLLNLCKVAIFRGYNVDSLGIKCLEDYQSKKKEVLDKTKSMKDTKEKEAHKAKNKISKLFDDFYSALGS